jgi:hypothetical protein
MDTYIFRSHTRQHKLGVYGILEQLRRKSDAIDGAAQKKALVNPFWKSLGTCTLA